VALAFFNRVQVSWGVAPNPANFLFPRPAAARREIIQALRNHVQVVGRCPTPHKLFEKSLIKNFTKVVF
jgi:hypothetical protein